MSTQLAVVEERAPARREMLQVIDPIPVLDSGRFEHMQRIATVMAKSSLIPESLCMLRDGKDLVRLPDHVVLSNCFLVVNQAVRWQMDPFAVAQCVSVVKGKLCYEGKLIAAVIEAKTGIELDYEWNDAKGDALEITVSGTLPNGKTKTVKGTVGEWKTTGTGSPWMPGYRNRMMLAYRGAREWCRLHKPGLMLGVYSTDEMEDLADNAREFRTASVSRIEPPPPPAPAIEPPKVAAQEPPPPPPVAAQAEVPAAEEERSLSPQESAAEIIGEIESAVSEQMLDEILDIRADDLDALPRELFGQIETAATSKRDAFRKAEVLRG